MTAGGGARPWLSVVMPFYRKLAEFERVVALNAPSWSRAGIEVVVALDDNAEESGLQRVLARFPAVCWTLVVNDRPHPWRPPSCAINVGVRHSAGRFVFVHSPESAYVGDAPAIALHAAMAGERGVAIGRVGFARFGALQEAQGAGQDMAAPLRTLFAHAVPDALYLRTFYGSLCCAREAFDAVGGYDESLAEWGGDDDNFRVRLEMAGWQLKACAELKLLHLSFDARDGGELFDLDNDWARCTPQAARANGDATGDWGRDFARIARKDTPAPHHPHQPHHPPDFAPQAEPGWLRPAPVFAMGSRLQCEICARMVHHEPAPPFHCPRCSAVPRERLTARPRIVCVMQLHNEARLLEGCLGHLRAHVDGFVLLDDGSTDGTAHIAQREPKLLELLSNPRAAMPGEPHVWNEPENRRRLLECARAHGAGWVLACDADERYETLFLDNLHAIVDSLSEAQLSCLSLAMRELWDAPDRFRVDGPWGRKSRACLFRLPQQIGFEQAPALHGPWYPDAVARHGVMYRSYYRLYHLKMIRREDRLARRDLYRRLDPQGRFQAGGYDYLAEEGPALRLAAVAGERGYDMASLPQDLAALLQAGPAAAASERAKSPR
ncbi:glycosyltransferase family 2 protein [Variovorax sp. GB1R11]|uniref:glycosyltransferase family 2 protein n=1 Tax=Variovorax sp. GB1R11 TaxID=3443741 RepID=UPI003F48EA13